MHDESLTKETAALLPIFKRFEGYYLVGGTALALHIGHRVSVDFDFFSTAELPRNLLERVKYAFSGYTVTVTYAAAGEQLNCITDGVKMTFLHYPYPVIEPFTEYHGIALASIPEIATMKGFAVRKRIAYKDYVDWYFLLKEGFVTLENVIALAKQKYGNDFNDRLFLGQLISLADAPTQKIDFLKEEPTREIIEEFLKNCVKAYLG